MTSVFISHASSDKTFVRRLERELRKNGVSVWVDERQIKVGEKISTRIQDGIDNSDFFLIVLSHKAVGSAWVNEELDSAHFKSVQERRGNLLPVLIDDVQVPLRLRGYKYADFRKSFRRGLKELLDKFEIDEDYAAGLPDVRRHEMIHQILRTTDKFGDLPASLTSLITDVSDLSIFEANLNLNVSKVVLFNSIEAIHRLGDYNYDGRILRSSSSAKPLMRLYTTSADEVLREKIIAAMGSLGSKYCYDSLVDWLPDATPRLKAAILTELSTWDREDAGLAIPWRDALLSRLHEYATWPDAECLYFDYQHTERDFRFWVFRCLGEARSRTSVPIIEQFIATKDWPLAVLAEAAAAHWWITRSDTYVPLLRKAKKLEVACCATVTLDEIAKFKRRRSQRVNRVQLRER